jgi:2-dehydro-3-deoxyphosphooctonate aldolase (KDO 8-P synthase)
MIIIAGPCVVEDERMLKKTASVLVKSCEKFGFKLIFKSSFKKANRSSIDSFTGIGDVKALKMLRNVKREFGVDVLTDVHSNEQAYLAAEYVDVLQIPAFLSRQTDLLISAGKTGKLVNIKKGQFMAPDDMAKAVEKVVSTGNKNILLTERGVTFGYHDLVVDFRSILIMKEFGYPIVYDATHSLQQPSIGRQSGGLREFIPALARAAVAVGVDGVFFETHPNPSKAKSDSATQLDLDLADKFLSDLKLISEMKFSL